VDDAKTPQIVPTDDYSWETDAAVAKRLRALAMKEDLTGTDLRDLRSYARTAADRLDERKAVAP
jgi:hypothetical protein